jgi:hypothetical protein
MRNLRFFPLAALAAVLALHLAPAAAQEGAEARVRIPKAFACAGQTYERGTYTLRLEPGAEGPYLVLSSGEGGASLRELAIVEDGKRLLKRPQASAELMTRDEAMVRLTLLAGDKRYLAFFETR